MVDQYLSKNDRCTGAEVYDETNQVKIINLVGLWIILLIAVAVATLHALARRYLFTGYSFPARCKASCLSRTTAATAQKSGESLHPVKKQTPTQTSVPMQPLMSNLQGHATATQRSGTVPLYGEHLLLCQHFEHMHTAIVSLMFIKSLACKR
jgi:hypothetical protein